MKRVMFLLLLAMAVAPEAWAQTWPNEPAGSTVINDWGWNSCPGGGWQPAYSCAVIRSDSTAPSSPSSVLRMEYSPSSASGGGDPYIILNNLNEMYVGIWVKLSNPYQGLYNGANKLWVAQWGDGGLLWLEARGQQYGPWVSNIIFQDPDPNINNCHIPGEGDCTIRSFLGGNTFVPGTWHRMEVYYKRSSSYASRDGVVKVWKDGALALDMTNANTPQAPLTALYVTPTWDGTEQPPRTNPDTISFDHIHVSTGGSGSGGTPKGDTTPPAAPTSLRAF